MAGESPVSIIPSLDLSAQVDPVIVSVDPVIRRASTRALTIQEALASDFFVLDTTNRRVGIELIDGETFAPAFSLHSESQGTGPIWMVDHYGSSAENFEFAGRKSEGTKAAPTALVDDDDMWEFSARGYDGVAFSGQQAAILFEAAGAWTATSHGTRQVLKTTEAGTTTLVEVLVLGDDGCVVVTGQVNGLIGAVAGEFFRCNGASRFNGNMAFSGDFDVFPVTDDDGRVGTPTNRWTLIRGVTITAGDLAFENGWRVTEDYDDEGLIFQDRLGKEIFAVRKSGLYFGGKKIAGHKEELALVA